MATDEWMAYGGSELINLARTTALAMNLGIDTLWVDEAAVDWVRVARGGEDYEDVSTAPWYDPGAPASAEFAGIVPLSITGLDDSSKEATTTEYITDGGSSGKPRNKTQPLVFNVALVATTDRGADFGKRWLDRRLSGSGDRTFCVGSELHYYQWEPHSELLPPVVHRRNVTITRATSVTRKRKNYCSSTWLVTFTLTANDPFEYSEEVPVLSELGGVVQAAVGTTLLASGTSPLVEESCPVYDYTPLYNPLYPALVEPPTAPEFYPEGWEFLPGKAYQRWWAQVSSPEPSSLGVVPVVRLTGDMAQWVRVSVWPGNAGFDATCEPLWTAMLSYKPDGVTFYIDGEQQASYVWDGVSPVVRRADSLVFGVDANPMEWSKFNDAESLLVALDIMDGPASGGGTVRAALSFVAKSD